MFSLHLHKANSFQSSEYDAAGYYSQNSTSSISSMMYSGNEESVKSAECVVQEGMTISGGPNEVDIPSRQNTDSARAVQHKVPNFSRKLSAK